jgi:putative membrane protein
MTKNAGIAKWQTFLLWTALLVYVQGRICQLYPETISVQLIVFMQVVPPAVLALVHGTILYGVKGMSTFAAFCLGVGAACEILSLHTGFPFGHYYFTSLMGPSLFHVPILLVLAYLGIGYCSWVLSLLILEYRNKPLTGYGVISVPLLASLIMLAWDLSMEAIWSTIDRAWIWRDGGSFYGVPMSNFLGWYFTAFLFYQAFALYCRNSPMKPPPSSRSYWRAAILCYGICAGGNLLIFKQGLFPPAVIDASGKQWSTMDILIACTLISVLAMGPMALLAWHRLKMQEVELPGK